MNTEQLSEYIVKIPNVLDPKICKSLVDSIEGEGDFSSNLVESDLIVLSDIVKEYFEIYLKDYFPKACLNDDDATGYSLELGALKLDNHTEDCFNLGGEGKSHRYLAFTFVISMNKGEDCINFPAQKVLNIYNHGDLYVTPPYFTHRFLVESIDNGGFRAVSMFLRH
jgi:hypothetical protein